MMKSGDNNRVYLFERIIGNNVVRLRDGKIVGCVTSIHLDKDRRKLEKVAFTGNRFAQSEQIALIGEDIIVIRLPKEAQGEVASATQQSKAAAERCGTLQCAKKHLSKEASSHNWWIHNSSSEI